MSKYTFYSRLLPISVCLFLALVLLLVYAGASCVLDGYTTWGMETWVMDIAIEHLENNPDWPKSWDDLENAARIHCQSQRLVPPTSDEFTEWRKHVAVDFSLTRAQVAAMTVQNFSAIRATRATAGDNFDRVQLLLEATRQDIGCIVLEVLAMYLKNHAEWPKSWDDLQDTYIPREKGGFYHPSQLQLDKWKNHVSILFGTNRARVAAMKVENFDAQLQDRPEDLTDLLRLIVKRVTDNVQELALEVEEWIKKHQGLGPGYAWPGNFRELEQCTWNVLIRKEYRPPRLERKTDPVEDLIDGVRQGTLTADELERRYATLIFAKTGSYQETSRRLGRNWRTIKSKIDPALLRELRKHSG